MDRDDLAIVGGGFGACAALLSLVRQAPPGLSVAILAGHDGPGPGRAYATSDGAHLLNVRAARMGVCAEAPADFANWLAQRGDPADPDAFVPRALYGAYLREQWRRGLSAAAGRGIAVRVLREEAFGLEPAEGAVDIMLSGGGRVGARGVLVAEGPAAPAPLAADCPVWIGDPWPDGLARLRDAAGEVVVAGSGLSAIDAALSALSAPMVRAVTMVSLDAVLPLAHGPAGSRPAPVGAAPGLPSALLRQVRAAVRARDWHDVIDGLRGEIDAHWRGWSPQQQRRALACAASMWMRHRHRSPQPTLARLDAARAEGRLRLVKARIDAVEVVAGGVCLHTSAGPVRAGIGVDARGIARLTEATPTLCGRALASGLMRAAPVGFGVAGDRDHRATAPGMAPVHVIGAARYGDLIETTGAPEVRQQAATAVAALLSALVMPGAAPDPA